MSESAIERAVEILEGQAALAEAIGVSPGLVWQWLNDETAVHQRHFTAIETATGGAVTPHELLADELAKIEQRAIGKRRASR